MKMLLRIIAFYILIAGLITGAHGICQVKPKPLGLGWKMQPFKGYFTTKDGRTQHVDDFLNLSEFHTFIYRYNGIIMPMSVPKIKSITTIDGDRLRISQKNGEVLTAEMWDADQHRCMLFTVFQAEITHYVRNLHYVFHDESKGKEVQAEVPLCDVKKIVFE